MRGMSDSIFLLGDDGVLTEVASSPYGSEADLQKLLADHVHLLPGAQINRDSPRRWLLIKREAGIPNQEGGGDWWSIDHLVVDQDAVPTFVECKRASDTRSRREVVAQMLDYAANGIEYWAVDRLRQAATETARSRNRSLDQEILSLNGTLDEAEIERFWQQVESNLRAGKVRLIFVAYSTSKELRRLVEFLNDKMSDVEVIAVEIKQFLGGDNQKALVSRVVGLTESARVNKTENRAKRQTNRSE